jgi:LmbE family N-acetylglucosaminyl deacetylase
MPDHRLLILFAHPDDEAFPVGGTIAMHTARGVTARLITSTSGELGEIRQAGSATRDTIGEVRRAELAEAVKELGIESHDVLQYRDSGMAGWDDNHHPKAFVQADEHEVVARLVFEIRRFKPQVILTFEPGGLYGHPDHIAICNHATTAFHMAADPTAFPHHMAIGIQPHQTDRLFYAGRPKGFRIRMAETLRAAGVDFPMPPTDRADDGCDPDDIHITADVSDGLDAKLACIKKHFTQLQPDWPYDRVPREVAAAVMGIEHYMRAWPVVQPGENVPADFFQGL